MIRVLLSNNSVTWHLIALFNGRAILQSPISLRGGIGCTTLPETPSSLLELWSEDSNCLPLSGCENCRSSKARHPRGKEGLSTQSQQLCL
ncbi:hypothetical protein TNCV_601231 [Trichonephila clavipes]|nr:hypothetical protein TNCV_601231 [Trichonephila clavipes]